MSTKSNPDNKVNSLRQRIVIGFAALVVVVLGSGLWYSFSDSVVTGLVEGEDYQVVGEGNGRLTVTEYFSYGCVHCYTFEASLEDWVEDLPDDVTFTRSPVAFSPQWAVYSRIYYAAEMLNVLDEVHLRTFRNIHERNNPLTSPDAIITLFTSAGVSEDDARSATTRPLVSRALRGADQRQRQFAIRATPTLVVSDKYRIETNVVGRAGALAVAKELLQRERLALKQRANPST